MAKINGDLIMKHGIVFGASSDIALATIELLLANNYKLVLLANNTDKLNIKVKHFQVKYPNAKIKLMKYDASIEITHDKYFEDINEYLNNSIDLLLIAHGVLPDENLCSQKWSETKSVLQINSLSVLQICHYYANFFSKQSYGTIAVISSVAGDRVRQSNYTYGTSKAILNSYLSGLRNKLSNQNIQVLTILPGFVKTKMTEKLLNRTGFLWATPEKIAIDIVNAINKQKNILYTPFFWRYILLIIKHIPEFIFKKMKL
jgi:decaprenylphospho-beta-D-erythro-pentofuranosid-2-ulose 2-reductase